MTGVYVHTTYTYDVSMYYVVRRIGLCVRMVIEAFVQYCMLVYVYVYVV